MLALAASLFFTSPEPLDMPRAEAFLVMEDGRYRLEDRYDRLDLWTSRTVLGCWSDDDGRIFTLARLGIVPPSIEVHEPVTRVEYTASCVPLNRRDSPLRRRDAVARLVPFEPAPEALPPRQQPRGMKRVEYWQGTNRTAIVCSFLPDKSSVWYLAVWELAEGDDFAERMGVFEWKFLEGEWKTAGLWLGGDKIPESEREQLRADAHHSITNYVDWRWTDAEPFTILDDLPRTSGFVSALTNELPRIRARYAVTIPTSVDCSNTLSVARIYRSRDEYLDAVGDDMAWSAAYWSPVRRELVAHLPEGGEAELMRTIRHEAFHQYLSYACSMITASPWFNEGYAQYFEDEESLEWGEGFDTSPDGLERLAPTLPALMLADYDEFYGGSDAVRRMKYRLAWSIAVFIEKGAPDVRFRPFAKLKAKYVDALIRSRDMRQATMYALLGDDDLTKNFLREWRKFWERQ